MHANGLHTTSNSSRPTGVAHDSPVLFPTISSSLLNQAMSSDDDRDDLRDDEEDDEYRPSDNPLDLSSRLPSSSVVVPQPQKRGRKPHPNPAVRSAREAARRANHSVIEKRRREKINNALSELRTLVPTQPDEASVAIGSATNDATTGNSTKGQPKEYKLEVLVRTVGYLKQLIDRVEILERVTSERVRGGTRAHEQNIPLDSEHSSNPSVLESALCINCADPLRLSDPHIPSPRLPPSSEANSTYHQRLPSLASLLNPGPPPIQQLLSPPASGSLSASHRGSTSPSFPSHLPTLHLPSSSLSLPQQMPTRLDTSALPPPGRRLSSATPSPILYPSTETRCVSASSSYAKWSPLFPPQQRRERSHDDDLAISMLLNMSRASSKGRSSASSMDQPSPVEGRRQYSITEANSGGIGTSNTVTPSSLLGIHQSAPVGRGKRRPEWPEETDRAKRTKVE